ncbi:hypothetical protein RZQ58_29455, partial [Raoultella planticola]|uniref:hypothetical protein n=1 Tax=Raoultella planticola TaxID=575 RepID=UPI00292BF96B
IGPDPRNFNQRVSLGRNDLLIRTFPNLFFFSALMAVVSLAMLIVFTSESFSMDELESGRHWKNDCQLLEVNIQTGSFTSPVNKLDCAGIIINVPRLQYDEYIHQWELYKDKNK